MAPFLQLAAEVFDTASQSREDCNLAVLVGPNGSLHLLPAADWDLDCLRQQHGAIQAYRVTRTAGRVSVEARAAGQSCVLHTVKPDRILRPSVPPQSLLAA